MKPDDMSQLAQGAVAWQENQTHLAVMKQLDSVKIAERISDGDASGISEYAGMTIRDYYAEKLPENTLIDIVRRGRDDEISYLISRYNAFFENYETRTSGYLPASVQILIVKRHQKTEIDAITEYYGFCEEAQKVMFEEWSHDELVAYTQKHGFSATCQEIMLKTWSFDELHSYSLRHSFSGACEIWALKNWSDNDIWTYISRYQLSAAAQKLLIERGHHEEIVQYMRCHGLESSIYSELLKRGDHDEVMLALKNSSVHLSDSELSLDVVLKRGNHDEIMETLQRISSALTEEQQRLIVSRGDTSEMTVMVHKGLCASLIEEILTSFEQGSVHSLAKVFAFYTAKLDSKQEQRFIKFAPSDAFKLYIIQHYLSDSAVKTMIAVRSDEDISFYLENRPRNEILKSETENALIDKAYTNALFAYYQRLDMWNGENISFIHRLLSHRPLNYDLLIKIFTKIPVGEDVDENEVALMTNGSREDVKFYISDSSVVLCRKAFIALFFRVDPNLFEAYLAPRKTFFKD